MIKDNNDSHFEMRNASAFASFPSLVVDRAVIAAQARRVEIPVGEERRVLLS
jgi:hypothetical protein